MGDKTQGFMSLARSGRSAGILMWSEPLPVTLPSGEEAVVVLMDTQGAADDQKHKSQAVFALSALLSSLLIFNIMDSLSDDDLECIQPLLEYGQMVLEETSTSSFQKLLFLVRDWSKTDEFTLGADGGDRLVTKFLQRGRGKKFADVRDHIGDCFGDINGFLLPSPGQQVVGKPIIDIGSNDMEQSFVAGLKELMPRILAPENLNVKKIAGSLVTAGDLYNLFTCFASLFSSDELPKPDALMQATTEASLKTTVREAKSQYEEEMKNLLREGQPSLDQDELVRKHRKAAKRAEKAFNDRKKMGDEKMSQEHMNILVQEIKDCFGLLEAANAAKREKEKEDAEKTKRKSDEDQILGLIDTCTKLYTSEMERIVGTDGFVPRTDMKSAHNAAKEKAMTKFDVRIKRHPVEWDCRFTLTQIIGAHYRLMVFHNDTKQEVGNQQAARANMKAVTLAQKNYRTVLKGIIGDEPTAEELERRHQQAQQAAITTFESLTEGTRKIIATYLDGLKELTNEDLKIKKQTLHGNRA